MFFDYFGCLDIEHKLILDPRPVILILKIKCLLFEKFSCFMYFLADFFLPLELNWTLEKITNGRDRNFKIN